MRKPVCLILASLLLALCSQPLDAQIAVLPEDRFPANFASAPLGTELYFLNPQRHFSKAQKKTFFQKLVSRGHSTSALLDIGAVKQAIHPDQSDFYDLPKGISHWIFKVDRPTFLQRFTFRNHSARGMVSILVSNQAAPVGDTSWELVGRATWFNKPDVISVDMKGVKNVLVRAEFQIFSPGQISSFGLFGDTSERSFRLLNPSSDPLPKVENPMETRSVNVASLQAGAKVVAASSNIDNSTIQTIIAEDPNLTHTFKPTDPEPNFSISLGKDRMLKRVSLGLVSGPGTAELYLMDPRDYIVPKDQVSQTDRIVPTERSTAWTPTSFPTSLITQAQPPPLLPLSFQRVEGRVEFFESLVTRPVYPKQGMTLTKSEIIKTGPQGFVELQAPNSSLVRVAPKSLFQVKTPKREFLLQEGRILLQVLDSRRRMSIVTPTATAQLFQGVYLVEVLPGTGDTRIFVLSTGRNSNLDVRATLMKQRVSVLAGQYVVIPVKSTSPPLAANFDTATLWANDSLCRTRGSLIANVERSFIQGPSEPKDDRHTAPTLTAQLPGGIATLRFNLKPTLARSIVVRILPEDKSQPTVIHRVQALSDLPLAETFVTSRPPRKSPQSGETQTEGQAIQSKSPSSPGSPQ